MARGDLRFTPAGEMRKFFTIQQNLGAGTETPNWVTVGTGWGKTKSLLHDSREKEHGGQQYATRRTQVNMRYFPGLDATYRLLLRDGTHILNIEVAFDIEDMHFEHECMCTEILPQQ